MTDSNECGPAFCVCSKGAGSCGATCVIDAGGFDQYVSETSSVDASQVDGSEGSDAADGHEEAAAEDSGKDAAAVEASMNDGTLTDTSSDP